MKKIQDKDPLKLRNSPGSGKVYTLLVISLALFAAGIALFLISFFSESGKFNRGYYANIYTWNRERLADRMSSVEISFKIMPTLDDLRNRDQFPMEHRSSANEVDQQQVQWNEFFNYKQSYFWYNNTVKNFPQFHYEETQEDSNVSETFCVHLWWNLPRSEEKTFGLHHDVFGQPDCENSAQHTSYKWKANDPTTGQNFKLWKKVNLNLECSQESLTCKLECSQLGGVVGKDGQCHAYDIVDRICLTLDIMLSEDRRSEELYSNGGCYDGHVAHYQRAQPDHLYKLDYVPVEVRSQNDPYVVWAQSNYKINEDTSKLQMTSYVLLIAAFFFGLLTCVSYQSSKAQSSSESKSLNF
ncbi:UNKNOWN [Stylonychia lemnae]|uniref:Uncharacterized protein n=1 Tax=Stylonychia lemnae TaxID=5949 RepID=A0A077ZPL0_STYLE|nr:UNKNOWN [Stylonychia lemnae]|eukprot:CDW71828.1 UNKNOWN [Stylonychia lemnae]